MQLVNPTPPLPNAPHNFNQYDQPRFDGDLIRTLTAYLRDVAYRLNKSLTIDGEDPMEGDLDMGGNAIVNVSNVLSSTKVTVFTASGTFTPDANMIECVVVAWGGGGGGGGAVATGGATFSCAVGGNGGAKAQRKLTAADIGASKAVTIGAGGAGGTGAAGSAGAATTLGTLVSAAGGEPGGASGAAAVVGANPTNGAQSATGDIRGWTHLSTASAFSGGAGFSVNSNSGGGELGGQRAGTVNAAGTSANANSAAGGGATLNLSSQAAKTGGTGGSGLMIITEYLHA